LPAGGEGDSVNSVQNWYLAQIKPNAHRLAERNLLRQGFEVFLPLLQETRARGQSFISSTKPIFPGYLFVAAGEGQLSSVNNTLGISRLVSFGNVPHPVPAALIAGLKLRCDDNGVMALLAKLSAGDIVKIEQGPFAGFVATVDELDRNHRVWVLIDLMGRSSKLAVLANVLSRPL
jgi:transcriptional antiterminator RfaH